jgi:hypothetical protein
MKARKPATDGNKSLLGRIGAAAAQGKPTDPARSQSARPVDQAPEAPHGGWATSTYELLNGAEVSDDPDTVPSELLDELFAPKQEPPPRSDSGDPSKQGG